MTIFLNWWELLWIRWMQPTKKTKNESEPITIRLGQNELTRASFKTTTSRDKIRMNPNLIFHLLEAAFYFIFSYFGFVSNFQPHMSTSPSLALATNWYGSEIGLVLAILFQVWPQNGITRIFSFASVHMLKGEMLSYQEQQLQILFV